MSRETITLTQMGGDMAYEMQTMTWCRPTTIEASTNRHPSRHHQNRRYLVPVQSPVRMLPGARLHCARTLQQAQRHPVDPRRPLKAQCFDHYVVAAVWPVTGAVSGTRAVLEAVAASLAEATPDSLGSHNYHHRAAGGLRTPTAVDRHANPEGHLLGTRGMFVSGHGHGHG